AFVGRARAEAHARDELTRARINQERTVARDGLAVDDERVRGVGDEVAEVAGTGRRRIDEWNAEGLINRRREIHLRILEAAEEEGLVLLDGAAYFDARLVQLDRRLRRVVRVGEELA